MGGVYSSLVLIALALLGVFFYNGLIKARQLVENGWSDIEVQLKRRADLIPRLVDIVKGYAKHEQTLFSEIVEKRNQALAAGNNPKERGRAEAALRQPVGKLLAVAEAYPDLKASQNFLDLQNELSETENKIEMSRRFFNGAVRELNIKIQTFPINLIAKMFGFKSRDFFEISKQDAELPDVNLND